jgi:hypothetical protein
VGIATSVALTMFSGSDLSEAIGVPFYYGIVEAVTLGIYCVVAWKIGWTKAPRNISLWKAISTSYEIITVEKVENEKASMTVKVNPDDPDEEAFHYVQHAEAQPDDVAVETNSCATPSDCGVPEPDNETGIEVGIRRQKRSLKEKKEPSYMPVEDSLGDKS